MILSDLPDLDEATETEETLQHPSTGTPDDLDDTGDEQPGENEAPIREHGDHVEAPEEFEQDD